MELQEIKLRPWWSYLDTSQQELLEESFVLLDREDAGKGDKFTDYSFVVFPAAKAYEGFLKKFLLDLKLILPRQYSGSHFRIGRALNPELPVRYRYDWVWDKLARFCKGSELPNFLWEVWRESRNLVFHWYPHHKYFFTLTEAREKLEFIVKGIDKAFEECKVRS